MKQLEKIIFSAGIVVIAGLAVLALGWFARFWFSGCGEAGCVRYFFAGA